MTTIQVLEDGELEIIVEGIRRRFPATQIRRYEVERMRDLLAVYLMHDNGLRVSDALNMQPDSLDLDTRMLTITGGKGRKGTEYRRIGASKRVRELWADYLDVRVPGLTLLTTATGRTPHRTHYNEILTEIGEWANRPGLHPHLFRHTAITDRVCGHPVWLPEAWGPVRTQKWAGHRSITTTMKYVHVRPDIEDELDTLDRMEAAS